MMGWQRLRPALARRIRGPYLAVSQLEARLYDIQQRLESLEAASLEGRELAARTHDLLSGEMRALLRAIAAEEPANRRRLHELRNDADYRTAWTDPRPLVSVTLATRNRPELLSTRSLPSILGQSYEELEVIVVGDHADDATEQAVVALGDPRVRYRNLPQRVQVSDDPARHWLVAATMARNEGVRLARGRWIVQFDDDDAMHGDCIERLLEHAREDESEAVYGRVLAIRDGKPMFEIGSFPPEQGQFTWAAGIYHSGLRFLQRELFAADLGLPGDWFLAERMLRAGVRFGMVDAVLADIYPSPMNLRPG